MTDMTLAAFLNATVAYRDPSEVLELTLEDLKLFGW